MADDDYKHGEMDITAQEKTFDGFMRYVVNIGIVLHRDHHFPRDLRCLKDGRMRALVRSVFRALCGPCCARPRAGLAACAAEEVWAPDEVVSQARYVPSGPAKIQLLTMISNRNGSGGHSALLIDGPNGCCSIRPAAGVIPWRRNATT
jgi:hypothetical protein